MALPDDYAERVYAGVLGKVIGVYVGRPFEGWSCERLTERFGEISYYVHEQLGKQLIVPDDDISGTFTFLRALPDNGNPPDLTPQQVGEAWLNYLIEERTVLWWGGLGMSTEHTAYLRLKSGILPPASGSMKTNSRNTAEQIGAQIFIDGWGLVCPGDPERAADLARRAACVSHDGEAVYGAQVVAALVAQAFVEGDMDVLLDTATGLVPRDSVIARLHADVREWAARDGDWRATRRRIEEVYGYERYPGVCHMVPNHAVIVLALAYADDDFQRALMIGNTAGWDTDCNSGNIGCIMGVKLGLDGLDAGPDWRGPVADRLYLPSADSGRVISDAGREADAIVAMGRALAGEPAPLPKEAARYHFEYPGCVHGFMLEDSPECAGTATVENVVGHSELGSRSLAVRFAHVARGRPARVGTATFLPPARLEAAGGYGLMASPTLYPGQTVRARIALETCCAAPIRCALYIRAYGEDDRLEVRRGESVVLTNGRDAVLSWVLDSSVGGPIAEVGVEIACDTRADGTLYLDWLDWDGPPDVVLGPTPSGQAWRKAWVNAADKFGGGARDIPLPYAVTQNQGRGMCIQGTREWRGYRASVEVLPHMCDAAGLAVHVQGLRRYYALLLRRGGKLELVRFVGKETVLASADVEWEFDAPRKLTLTACDGEVRGTLDGATALTAKDEDAALATGAVALVCENGRAGFGPVTVEPGCAAT